MSYQVGVFSRSIPAEKSREADDDLLFGQAEAEALAESPLPPDPGTHFPYLLDE